MLFSKLVLIAGVVGSAVSFPVQPSGPYSVSEAASIARTLVTRESLTQFNTVQQKGSFKDLPVSFVEYYSDCNRDGNPFLLLVDMSTDYGNYAAGSPVTLSIKVGDHQVKDSSNPHYPGSIETSTMGSPRLMLSGRLVDAAEKYSKVELLEISKCFIHRHHDAAWWLPGSPIHASHWWQFEVEGVFFIGGFGDRAYIGEIPLEEYQKAELLGLSAYDEKLREMMAEYHRGKHHELKYHDSEYHDSKLHGSKFHDSKYHDSKFHDSKFHDSIHHSPDFFELNGSERPCKGHKSTLTKISETVFDFLSIHNLI